MKNSKQEIFLPLSTLNTFTSFSSYLEDTGSQTWLHKYHFPSVISGIPSGKKQATDSNDFLTMWAVKAK